MKPLFSTTTIRKVDEFAIKKLGVPSIVLMENASLEIFKYAEEKLKVLNQKGKIGLICGKGNNGGDGFALARQFINNGYNVLVIHLFDESEMTADCRTNFLILKKMILYFKKSKIMKYNQKNTMRVLKTCDLLVDAMLGSGIHGDLNEPYKSIVNKINAIKTVKLSVDIPTGLDADKGYSNLIFYSNLTVTLGDLKPGLFFGDGYAHAGEIVKGSIGVSSSFYSKDKANEFLIEAADAFASLPQKDKSVHKYSAGKVLTIAGSGKYSGAAILATKSSLKAGAGASILCFPKSIRNFVHKNLSEVVLKEYDDKGNEFLIKANIKELADSINWADVISVGPGLGRHGETQKAVIKLLSERKFRNIVIDADALFAISSKKYKSLNIKSAILTPHHGEFCMLIGIQLEDLRKDILRFGRKFVKETGSYLVLKGAPTIIFLPSGKVLINPIGNPGMAKFGTGDALTGIISGFLSQVRDIEKALIAGVYIHSLAADLLLDKFTELGFTATDLMNNIPSAIRYLRKSIV